MNAPALSIGFPAFVGGAALVALFGGVGYWSLSSQISGAVVTQGTVKVEIESQVVQHPDGGVVGEVLVQDGDIVAMGDTLLRLDETFLVTELAIVERQLTGVLARRGRLRAERARAETVSFADFPELVTVDAETLNAQLQEERDLFDARLVSLDDEVTALREQASLIEFAAEGAEAQLNALNRQLELVVAESKNVQQLFENGLVPVSRINALFREESRLLGEIGRISSDLSEARASVSQIEIEILRLGRARQEEAIAELRNLEFTEIELLERRNGLVQRLRRLDIRAPIGGAVFGSTIFGTQAVVEPAAPIMYIVPSDQPFQVAIEVDPTDIDQVFVGQPATLVFSAFNRRTTPEVTGEILRISADTSEDASTGASYYEAIVLPNNAEVAALGDAVLLPGMPVEAYLTTDMRTPFSYLVQPLSTYFRRAFREE